MKFCPKINQLSKRKSARVFELKWKKNKTFIYKFLFGGLGYDIKHEIKMINIIKEKKINGVILPSKIEEIDKGDHSDYMLKFDKCGIALNDIEIYDFKTMKTVCMQIVRNVQLLHEKDVWHMDIKPSNIVIYDQKIYLIDFGASDTKENYRLEKDINYIRCTPGYVPPENLVRGYCNHKFDVWSLAATLYYVIYKRKCFKYYEDEKEMLQHLLQCKGVTLSNIDIKGTTQFANRIREYRIKNNIKDAMKTCIDFEGLTKFEELFNKMTALIPSERIELDEVLETLSSFEEKDLIINKK